VAGLGRFRPSVSLALAWFFGARYGLSAMPPIVAEAGRWVGDGANEKEPHRVQGPARLGGRPAN
jgi:hypothetical protein